MCLFHLRRNYNYKCDIWSTGIIMYILYSGTNPFTGNNDKEIIHNIMYDDIVFDTSVWSVVPQSNISQLVLRFSDIAASGSNFVRKIFLVHR